MRTGRELFPDMSAARPGGKISPMRGPERSALMSPWSFMRRAGTGILLWGAVIDSATEGQETAVRYLMDNKRLSEEMFIKGKTPRSVSEFRSFNGKVIRQWCKTQTEPEK